MKLLDWIIIVAILGCVGVLYGGYRLEGALALAAVGIVASWRFYDRSREKHMGGASGTNVQDAPDSMVVNTDYSHDSGSSDSGGTD
ncbi:MAG TPA: hypothetical protein VGH19_22340 [Verrucomicrobiae bacterium]